MKRIGKFILFLTILLSIVICVVNYLYDNVGYGYFEKAVANENMTHFGRDSKIKYSNMNSYKIENKDFNNATFYKKIKVNKNTPYKISCMVKTENVEVLDNSYSNSGAKISILNSNEQSDCVTGNSDWKEVAVMLNSMQNDELDIGFMLGGDTKNGNVRGTAWFSDLHIEEGSMENDNNWNFACLIFKNTNVSIAGKNYKYAMTDTDVSSISDCMERFKSSISNMSGNKMKANYSIYCIDNPIESLSYDKQNGYYIDPNDVSNVISKQIPVEQFDHIFVCARLDDENSSIPKIRMERIR